MSNAPFDKDYYNPVVAMDFEQITVAGTAVAFTQATIQPGTVGHALLAMVTVETAPVRYRSDGTAPTASVGTLLNPGDRLIVWGSVDIENIQFIRTTGVSALLDVEYSN